MATRHLLAGLAGAGAGLPELEIESTGGVDAARRVARGDAFDLVFLASDALRTLAAEGHVVRETVTDLVVSHVAVAVPAPEQQHAPRQRGTAFDDASEMRAALLRAERIGYSTGPSGTALMQMIERWGLSDAVGPRLVQARPGVPVATLLANGEVGMGFQQLSELVGQPGIRILGVLPADCAIDTVFAGAVSARTFDERAAQGVLRRFASPEMASIVTAHDFDSVPADFSPPRLPERDRTGSHP